MSKPSAEIQQCQGCPLKFFHYKKVALCDGCGARAEAKRRAAMPPRKPRTNFRSKPGKFRENSK